MDNGYETKIYPKFKLVIIMETNGLEYKLTNPQTIIMRNYLMPKLIIKL